MNKIVFLFCFFAVSGLTAQSFEGKLIAELITDPKEDDREIRLLKPFAFLDRAGVRWDVPENTIVDGASIPRIFWTLIGAPLVGDYRNASVVHDYYCDVRTHPWRQVHRMFYEACLAGGVGKVKAKIMYAAVYTRGPRWTTVRGTFPMSETSPLSQSPGFEQTIVVNPFFDETNMGEITKWIDEKNPELSEIESKLDEMIVDGLDTLLQQLEMSTM